MVTRRTFLKYTGSTVLTLFAFNRFSGIDRLEGGERANVALHGAWYLGGDTVRRVTAYAAPRPVVPRHELMPNERAVIGLFEAAKGSVVFISTQERVLDY